VEDNKKECLGTIYKNTACMECEKCQKEMSELKKIPVDAMDEKQRKALKLVMKYDDGAKRKKKNLLRQENIQGVHLEISSIASWLGGRKEAKYQKCANCKMPFESLLDKTLSLVYTKTGLNSTVCNTCGRKLIENGARDISKEKRNAKLEKENLIRDIGEFGFRENYYSQKLEERSIEDLKLLHAKWKAIKEEKDRIDAIVIPKEDIGMECYLKKDYHVIEDPEYLKCTEQIEDYFSEDYAEFFDCGQGYYQDKANTIIKIGKKYFDVTLLAEIGSSKQDRGDRLYWVEDIEKVIWKRIEKPLPKERFNKTISFEDLSEIEWDNIKRVLIDYTYHE